MDLLKNAWIVKEVLTEDAQARDCDMRLYCLVLEKDLGDELDLMSASELMSMFKNATLRPYESITRCRRKLQEQNESLRGKQYRERHNACENVKEQLRLF